ncbi:gag pol polyprotein [Lasius niger]|uniref:Gag pol polyprotein n=1 Tax=Lasius niger TaxID=67767 RepID=A0A0J7KND0_LASNI|nr:gag pol polyprotein [Lasius niger]
MHIQSGKRRGQSLMAANDNSPGPRRLFIVDRNTKTRYLIDTGSDVSVYPRSKTKGRQRAETYQLFAANGSTIITYGTITLQPNLGLRSVPLAIYHRRRDTAHHKLGFPLPLPSLTGYTEQKTPGRNNRSHHSRYSKQQ